jgi:hypothetical protein
MTVIGLLRLDVAVEASVEHYRFVNERFSEYRYSLREYRMLVLIVVLIFFQTMVITEDFWRPYWDSFMDQIQRWTTPAPTVTTPAPTPAPLPAPTPAPTPTPPSQ